ncbi:hypothetical protein PMAYCL1PPCAC_05565, partial [Pristionchus mayeri]
LSGQLVLPSQYMETIMIFVIIISVILFILLIDCAIGIFYLLQLRKLNKMEEKSKEERYHRKNRFLCEECADDAPARTAPTPKA